jgi:DNA polymerase-3 subunit beta
MRFTVQKQIIESILTNLQPFLEKRDTTQITSHIYFDIDNISTIKATDEEIGLSIRTEEINIEERGSFSVNGKRLLDIIKRLRNEEIKFKLVDGTLYVRQNYSNFKLPTFDSDEFPDFPSTDGKPSISLSSTSLIKSLKKVFPSIDTNNPKYELNGALINIEYDKTDIVGTDTRRLAVSTIDKLSENELELIIPKKSILEIQKLFLDGIEMFYDKTVLIIKSSDMLLFTRLINGNFPPYIKVIPQNTKYEFSLPTKPFISSIKMITTVSNDIRIEFTPNSIIFSSISTDDIEAKTEIEMNLSIEEEIKIHLNSRYLLDFLDQVESEDFEIRIDSTTEPFVVADGSFITVIMPIMV